MFLSWPASRKLFMHEIRLAMCYSCLFFVILNLQLNLVCAVVSCISIVFFLESIFFVFDFLVVLTCTIVMSMGFKYNLINHTISLFRFPFYG